MTNELDMMVLRKGMKGSGQYSVCVRSFREITFQQCLTLGWPKRILLFPLGRFVFFDITQMLSLRLIRTNFRERELLWGVVCGSIAAALYGFVRKWFLHGISELGTAADFGPSVHVPILVALLAALLLIAQPFLRKTACLVRSWWVGLVRGTTFFWGFCTFLCWLDRRHWILFFIAAAVFEITVDLRDSTRQRESYSAEQIATCIPVIEKSNLTNVGFDKPIQNWSQDAIGRREFVSTLLNRALVDCEPAIGICAEFGEGKSSVLHLIENTIKQNGKAIVVPFRTWLPDGEEKLLDSLFATATSAIREKYFLATWRPVLNRYGRALVGAIPKSWAFIGDFLPSGSQPEQIDELTQLFSRLPVRVVFLLDEIDRMHEEELRVLLKILRGAPELTNVTYICAFSKEALARLISPDVAYGCRYLDKFFPVQLQLPRIDADLRERLFSARLADTLESEGVFSPESEGKRFADARSSLWHEALKERLTNFRTLGQLLRGFQNSLHVLKTEVYAFDLLVIESVRMLLPSTYEFIYLNSRFFQEPTGGIERWNRTSDSGIDKEARKKAIAAGLSRCFEALSLDDRNLALGLLVRIFPSVKEFARENGFRAITISGLEGGSRRISDSNFFPRYFEYSVPATMFGEKEMDDFLAALSDSEQDVVTAKLEATLPGSEPDDLRRIHFLRRLRERASETPPRQARFLAVALAKVTTVLTSEFVSYQVLKGAVLALAARIQGTPEFQAMLIELVRVAGSDRFASDIVYSSVSKRDTADEISNWEGFDSEAIKKAFGERMRLRHPRPVSALLPVAADDVMAFSRWRHYVPSDSPYLVDYFTTAFDFNLKNIGIFLQWLLPGNVTYQGSPIKFVESFYTPISDLISRLKKAERESVQWGPEEAAAIQRFWEFLKDEPQSPVPTTPST